MPSTTKVTFKDICVAHSVCYQYWSMNLYRLLQHLEFQSTYFHQPTIGWPQIDLKIHTWLTRILLYYRYLNLGILVPLKLKFVTSFNFRPLVELGVTSTYKNDPQTHLWASNNGTRWLDPYWSNWLSSLSTYYLNISNTVVGPSKGNFPILEKV